MGSTAIRAAIFDLDGVLISSSPLHYYAFRQTFAPEGVDLSWERYLEVGLGAAREEVIRRVLGDLPAAKLAHLMAEKERWVYDYLEKEELEPIAGSLEFLARVRAAGLRTAVATASRTPLPFLKAIGALEEFEAVVDRSMVAAPKPDPAIYLLAAEKLQVQAQECLVIEDSPIGIASALAAGMNVVAVVTTHAAEELAAATHVAADFEAIDLDALIR